MPTSSKRRSGPSNDVLGWLDSFSLKAGGENTNWKRFHDSMLYLHLLPDRDLLAAFGVTKAKMSSRGLMPPSTLLATCSLSCMTPRAKKKI